MLDLAPDARIFNICSALVACNLCHARISTLDCDEDSVYRYTSGRWLWNEKEQFSRRYVKFNLAELVKIATQATGSMSCVEVQKLPEGNFNKVFLLTMNDGKEVIAKLPNPNAGPQYFATASEVKRSHGYCLFDPTHLIYTCFLLS